MKLCSNSHVIVPLCFLACGSPPRELSSTEPAKPTPLLPGTVPAPGPTTCADAIASQSYVGCEYFPTVTPNSTLYPGFSFALVVANSTDESAAIKVSRKGELVAQAMIAPKGIETIKLPWVDELKQDRGVWNVSHSGPSNNEGSSDWVANGSFRLESSVPVTVHQFNPLEFELTPAPSDCAIHYEDGRCPSSTNDASLLLPSNVFGSEYYVMSWGSFYEGGPGLEYLGFVAITATADKTNVTVESPSFIHAGAGVAASAPGTTSYTIDRGDVLLLSSGSYAEKPCEYGHCVGTRDHDLTGTHIVSDKPVGVLAGHDCTFIPYDQGYCDHLEETMFPVPSLGKRLVMSALHAPKGETVNKAVLRVLSAADKNTIRFEPAIRKPVTLNKGEWIELLPTDVDVVIEANNRISAGQYSIGSTATKQDMGDPGFVIGVPAEQYRKDYGFLTPSTYVTNYVNIVAPSGAEIVLDGKPVAPESFAGVGTSGFAVSRQLVEPGPHAIAGSDPFGITLYGYAPYTSYLLPGGLDVRPVSIAPN